MSTHRSTAQERKIGSASTLDLHDRFKGKVITATDPEYDSARTVFYGGFDRHPAAIVRVADAEDASRLVSLAREQGIELAIRSGGHSVVGHSSTEGGIVLDLSAMKAIQIDPQEKTAWAQAGLTAGEFTQAAGAYDLAAGFGDTASVGLGGITLGGGVGYLVRKYGLTIDSLLAAEVVTADGQIRQVDENSDPDLFWAIRGGGGNFGVVTNFKIKLQNVKMVLGGMLILPATEEVITGFVQEAEAAPDELTTILNIMVAPPMPFLPKEANGKLIAMALMTYAGDAVQGERVLAPFRALAQPYADLIRPIPYAQMFPPEEGGNFHPAAVQRTKFLDHVDRSVAETILEHLRASKAFMSVAQLRVLGGEISRVPVDATAFAHRNSRIMANLAALYQVPAEKSVHEAWVADFAMAIQQSDQGAYVNFLSNASQEQIRAAYPGKTWDRLRLIKRKYDPTNLFRLNQNIPPM